MKGIEMPFWMVWRRGFRVPRFLHKSYDAARMEADRLAGLFPMGRFVVLQACYSIGPGTEPPPKNAPKKAKQPPPEPLTPEQREAKQAAKKARKAAKKEEWEKNNQSSQAKPRQSDVAKPVKTLAEIRKESHKKD